MQITAIASDNVITDIYETEYLRITSTIDAVEYQNMRIGVPVVWEIDVEIVGDEAATINNTLEYSGDFNADIRVESGDATWEQSDSNGVDQTWTQTGYTVNTDSSDENTQEITVNMTPGSDFEPSDTAEMSMNIAASGVWVDDEDEAEVIIPVVPEDEDTPEPSETPGVPTENNGGNNEGTDNLPEEDLASGETGIVDNENPRELDPVERIDPEVGDEPLAESDREGENPPDIIAGFINGGPILWGSAVIALISLALIIGTSVVKRRSDAKANSTIV